MSPEKLDCLDLDGTEIHNLAIVEPTEKVVYLADLLVRAVLPATGDFKHPHFWKDAKSCAIAKRNFRCILEYPTMLYETHRADRSGEPVGF